MTTSFSSSENPMDALLAGYACGALSPELHSLVAAHLFLKPDHRGFVCALEALGGDAIALSAPAPLRNRDERLSAIVSSSPLPVIPAKAGQQVLPRELERFIGSDIDTVPWRTLLPGIKEHRVAGAQGTEAALLWVRAGRTMPSHSHEGSEITLVLKGGFRDETGHFRRGDIAFADAQIDHHPIADDDEDCICFAVTDAPVRLTGPIGRLVQKILRN